MEEIKNYLKEKGIYPKVNLDDKEPHTVEIVKAKKVVYEDGSTSMKLLVKEGDELRIISSPSLLVEVQDCEEGDIYKVQLRYRMIGGKPFRDYSAEKIGGKSETKGKEEDKDIPVVEDKGTEPTAEQIKETFGE